VSIGIVLFGAVAYVVLHYAVLPYIDGKRNSVLTEQPQVPSASSRNFHESAFVADLHADSLLWGRDLRKPGTRGHIDIPRLVKGGIDLQVFGVVTKVPSPRNYDSNRGDTDALPLLFIAAWRAPSTWMSPKQRALAQAEELTALAEQTELTIVLQSGDLGRAGLKGLLALEGMHALGGDEKALLELHSAGFRMMGLAHFFDNEVAGSAHGVEKYGLTALGRSLIPRMEALGITIDLAHASRAAFEDALALATKPVVVSHGGVQGSCAGPRNLSDDQLRSIARNGGVVGIGYWKGAVCAVSVSGIVAAIRHAVEVAGLDHVGLGSDFDGNIAAPFDVTGVPKLTEALLADGFTRREVRKLLGENVRQVLSENLPE
jgi:microsomal dipeptidase-like Zn-dependent dipeptidase